MKLEVVSGQIIGENDEYIQDFQDDLQESFDLDDDKCSFLNDCVEEKRERESLQHP